MSHPDGLEIPVARSRILLRVSNARHEGLLRELLAQRYEVLPTEDSPDAWEGEFDLCVLDGPRLEREADRVAGRRARERPTFLPFLALSQGNGARAGEGPLARLVDEIITLPTTKASLIGRVDAALARRRESSSLAECVGIAGANVEAMRSARDLRERSIAMLAHDLRTPLSSARMAAQLVKCTSESGSDADHFGGRIVANIDRVDGMIRDMLDASRMEAGAGAPLETSAIDLSEVAAQAAEELREIHGRRIRYVREGSDFRGRFAAPQIRRVLENLCGNAVKYGATDADVTVGLTEYPDRLELSVHNEGAPISEEERATIFAPFKRTDSSEREGEAGWGLGLALVRGIVTAHGGQVGVESRPGAGTTFTAVFPKGT